MVDLNTACGPSSPPKKFKSISNSDIVRSLKEHATADSFKATFIDSNAAIETLMTDNADLELVSHHLYRLSHNRVRSHTEFHKSSQALRLSTLLDSAGHMGVTKKDLIANRTYTNAVERIYLKRSLYLTTLLKDKKMVEHSAETALKLRDIQVLIKAYKEAPLDKLSDPSTDEGKIFDTALIKLSGVLKKTSGETLGTISGTSLDTFDRSVVGWTLDEAEIRSETSKEVMVAKILERNKLDASVYDSPESFLEDVRDSWTTITDQIVEDAHTGQLISDNERKSLKRYRNWVPFYYDYDLTSKKNRKRTKKAKIKSLLSGEMSADEVNEFVWGVEDTGVTASGAISNFRSIVLAENKPPPDVDNIDALEDTITFAITTKIRADKNLTNLVLAKEMATLLDMRQEPEDDFHVTSLTNLKALKNPNTSKENKEAILRAAEVAVSAFDPLNPTTWMYGFESSGFLFHRFYKPLGSNGDMKTIGGIRYSARPLKSWTMSYRDDKGNIRKMLISYVPGHRLEAPSSKVFTPTKSLAHDYPAAQILMYLSATMRKIWTTTSLLFLAAEAVRTYIGTTGLVDSVIKDLPNHKLDRAKLVSDTAHYTIRAFGAYLRYSSKDAKNPEGFTPNKDDMYEMEIYSLIKNGGLRRLADMNKVDDFIDNIKDTGGGKNSVKKTLELIEQIINFIEEKASVVDVAPSIGLSLALKDQGVAPTERSSMAIKYPVDFNQSGSAFMGTSGSVLNGLFLFFGVSLKGAYNTLRSFSKSDAKGVAKFVGSSGAIFVAVTYLAQLMQLLAMDDEEFIQFQSLPKKNEWGAIQFWDGGVVRIPLTWGYNFSAPLANLTAISMREGLSDVYTENAIGDAITSFYRNYAPFVESEEGDIESILPITLLGVVEDAQNRVKRNTQYGETLPFSENAGIYASEYMDILNAGSIKIVVDTFKLIRDVATMNGATKLSTMPLIGNFINNLGEYRVARSRIILSNYYDNTKRIADVSNKYIESDIQSATKSMFLLGRDVYHLPYFKTLQKDYPEMYAKVMSNEYGLESDDQNREMTEVARKMSKILSLQMNDYRVLDKKRGDDFTKDVQFAENNIKNTSKILKNTLTSKDYPQYLTYAEVALTHWAEKTREQRGIIAEGIKGVLANEDLSTGQRKYFEALAEDPEFTAYNLPMVSVSSYIRGQGGFETGIRTSYNTPKTAPISLDFLRRAFESDDENFDPTLQLSTSKTMPIHIAAEMSAKSIQKAMQESRDLLTNPEKTKRFIKRVSPLYEDLYGPLADKSFYINSYIYNEDINLEALNEAYK